MLTVAYIGFGNSVVRYHLPYIQNRKQIRVKSIYRRPEDRVGDEAREGLYPNIRFVTDIDAILRDEEIHLTVLEILEEAIRRIR